MRTAFTVFAVITAASQMAHRVMPFSFPHGGPSHTTGLGGFCVVHDEKLRKELGEINKDLVDPSWKECLELKLMYFVRTYIINDFTYWPMIRLHCWLSRGNLLVGSSSGEDVEGTKMPEGFLKKQSAVQLKKGIKSLKKLDDVNRLRKENARKYTEVLKELVKTYVDESLFNNHIFIRYPLLVKDRELFGELAEKEGIILGEWSESLIYPAYNPYDVWSLKAEAPLIPCASMSEWLIWRRPKKGRKVS